MASSTKDKRPASGDEELEKEWQSIVDFYDPQNVEKMEVEARRRQEAALREASAASEEEEQVGVCVSH